MGGAAREHEWVKKIDRNFWKSRATAISALGHGPRHRQGGPRRRELCLAWCHTFTSALLASFEKMYKAAVDWFEEQCKRLEPPKPLCQQNC